MTKDRFDIIVVGGGLAGLTAATGLKQQGLRVLCLDAKATDKRLAYAYDGRTTAINRAGRDLLQSINIWEEISDDGCPITDIEISDRDVFHCLDFNLREISEDADDITMGWIFENRLLRRALVHALGKAHRAPALVTRFDYDSAQQESILTLANGSHVKASLVIAADGRRSQLRDWAGIETFDWDYKQKAIVCVCNHEHPHKNWAIEHFFPAGPFAILPMEDDDKGQHRSSIVWTLEAAEVDDLLALPETEFQAAIQSVFGERYGKVTALRPRHGYPLRLQHARRSYTSGLLLLGEALRVMHPIAGQGFNVTIRDIQRLLDHTKEVTLSDLGSPTFLKALARAGRFDDVSMMAATDSLNRLFSTNQPVVSKLRRLGMRGFDRLDGLKTRVIKHAMGL